MKPFFKLPALVFVILFFVGCASNPNKFKKVKDLNKPIITHGFSIMPPSGEDWQYRKPNELEVVFGKKGDGLHTFGANVTISPAHYAYKNANDFLEDIEKQLDESSDPNRFSDIHLSIGIDKKFGALCARYVSSANDDAASKKRGGNLILKVIGYSFIHPDSSGFIVSIAYHERADEDRLSNDFIERGEAFASGFKSKNFDPDMLIKAYYYLSDELEAEYAAETVTKEALDKYKKKGDEDGMAEAYHTLGNHYKFFNSTPPSDTNLNKSLNNFMKANELYRKNNNFIGVTKCTFGIGNVYNLMGNKVEACSHYDKSLQAYSEAKKRDPDAKMPVRVPPYDFIKLVDDFKKQAGCQEK